MRHLALIAFGIGLVTAGASATADDLFRVMSYNIHHGQGLDGKLNLNRIAAVISEAKPDFVALQEVDFKTRRSGGVDQAARLGELCKMHAVFGRAIDYQGGQYGNAVLALKPIDATKNHRLPRADGKENRFALAAKVQLNRRQHIVFFATHFDHKGSRARKEASEAIAALVPKSELLVVLAGDLNCEPDAPELRPLSSVFSSASHEPLSTFPAKSPSKQIDYILFDKRARWRVETVEVLDDGGASDHLPILATIRSLR